MNFLVFQTIGTVGFSLKVHYSVISTGDCCLNVTVDIVGLSNVRKESC
jgi:hypothetical protein